MIIGQKEIFITETGSTNQYAKEMLSNFKPFEGTAIFADNQTHGKGQNGNVWQGKPGQNLYLSVILFPHFLLIKDHYLLNKAVCLSVWESVSEFCEDVKIKWPNDIYVNGRKLAGILIENSLQGNKWQNAIVGIGVNLNQIDFSPDIKACSIRSIINKEIDGDAFRKLLYSKLNKNYLAIRASQTDLINSQYTKNLLGYHEKSNFTIDGKTIEAVILGVQNTGELCLEMDSKLQYFRHGEVRQEIV